MFVKVWGDFYYSDIQTSMNYTASTNHYANIQYSRSFPAAVGQFLVFYGLFLFNLLILVLGFPILVFSKARKIVFHLLKNVRVQA